MRVYRYGLREKGCHDTAATLERIIKRREERFTVETKE